MRSVFCTIVLLLALPVATQAKPKLPADLVSTHGYVHVAFPKGGGEALTVRPVAGGKEVMVDTPATALPLANAQAFGTWLPAGRYRVAGWGVREWKDGPEFEVQAGRVTDLGDLVVASLGGYQFVLVPIPHREHEGSMAAATQTFASVLKDTAPVPFEFATVSPMIEKVQPDSGMGLIVEMLVAYERKVNKPSTLEALKATKDPAEFLRLVRTMTAPLQDEPARLADGTLFFPADFGQLRKRSPNGEWSNIGIDSVRQLLAVEHADGRLLAGSDDGRIRQSRDDGKSWTDVKALGRQESVLDIDHANGAWIVSTVERFEDPNAARGGGLIAAARGTPSLRLRVYLAQREDLGDLAISKEFTLAPKDQVGWLGARGQLVDGRYYILAGTALQRLDVASGQWTAITPGPRISSHRVDPGTGVITAMWSQGAFSKVYVSSDRGGSWAQIGRPPYIINDVQMDAADRGWASRWNMNAFSGVWETYAFVPAKNDWDKSGEAPFNCRLMRIAADIPVLCFAPDANILGLHDGKWEVEFSAQ